MRILALTAALFYAALFMPTAGMAEEFRYLEAVELEVGDSVILKGVRGRNCGDPAPAWERVASGLPSSDLGSFADGGAESTQSDRCGGSVPARGVEFTATKSGTETLEIYTDEIRITVR
jgi:hypothetical protein